MHAMFGRVPALSVRGAPKCSGQSVFRTERVPDRATALGACERAMLADAILLNPSCIAQQLAAMHFCPKIEVNDLPQVCR